MSRHRAEEEPRKDPDEDEDVDRLERQRPPVDMHHEAQWMKGLANSTSSAITRQ